MKQTTELPLPVLNAPLQRCRLAGFAEDGTCLVAFSSKPSEPLIACDLMQTSDQAVLCLASGDEVMVWLPTPKAMRGVILGRIGPSSASASDNAPDELVLKASQNLTLQCGTGSITLRGDGRVLIKGKDLVSHAERNNRIMGTAVAIN